MTVITIIMVAAALAVALHKPRRTLPPARVIAIEITITTRSDGIGSGQVVAVKSVKAT